MNPLDGIVQPVSCDTCPFNTTGLGKVMHDELAPGRFESILDDLRQGKTFYCHKTHTAEQRRRPKGALVCAGALAYQRKNNCIPDAIQVVERMTAMVQERPPRW